MWHTDMPTVNLSVACSAAVKFSWDDDGMFVWSNFVAVLQLNSHRVLTLMCFKFPWTVHNWSCTCKLQYKSGMSFPDCWELLQRLVFVDSLRPITVGKIRSSDSPNSVASAECHSVQLLSGVQFQQRVWTMKSSWRFYWCSALSISVRMHIFWWWPSTCTSRVWHAYVLVHC